MRELDQLKNYNHSLKRLMKSNKQYKNLKKKKQNIPMLPLNLKRQEKEKDNKLLKLKLSNQKLERWNN